MTIDFDRIRRDYPLPEIVARSGVDLKKNGNEFEACCPFHSEKTASFRVYKKGDWKFWCFGCGANGDVVDFVQERYNLNKIEAVRQLDGEVKHEPVSTARHVDSKNVYDGYDIGRPPEDTPPIEAGKRTPKLLNPKRLIDGKPKLVTYTPEMVFPYRTKDGKLICYVLRVVIDGKKLTPVICWMKNKATGFEGWSHGSFPEPRPLYGLDDLYANPTHQVLLVEGEKCKDAGKRVMAGRPIVSTSWMGGGKSLSKTHWKSLAGRRVLIWTDNDVEGWRTTMGYATPSMAWKKGLLDYLFEAGVAEIKVMHIPPGSRAEGWDIADAEQEGMGLDGIAALIRSTVETWSRERFDTWKGEVLAKAGPQATRDDAAPVPLEPQGADDWGADHAQRSTGDGDDDKPPPTPAALEGRGFQINDQTWRQHMIMKADGDGLKSNSLQNAALLVQYEQRFAGIYAWNDFAKHVYLMRRPPWDVSGDLTKWTPRKMIDADVTATAQWLEYSGMSTKRNDAGAVIDRVAQHNSFNPLQERIRSLKWDGVPRLSGTGHGSNQYGEDDPILPWLSRYFGAEDNLENRAFGRKWMISAIARAMNPGCKVDTMLVIEGAQGLKKSTALRIIADAMVPGLFTDEISDPGSKDAGLQMQGKWIIEIAELDAFRRAENSSIKAWLTRQVDRFRRPYGKITEDFPRNCVLAGTHNVVGGMGYLKDPSGARRFWPFAAHNIDLDALAKDAEQLWAEAAAAYEDGEQWWLDEEEDRFAKIAQEKRYETDPYDELIDRFVQTRTSVTVDKIMAGFEIPKERRSSLIYRRIAAHLHTKGWKRVVDGDRVLYVRPDAMV